VLLASPLLNPVRVPLPPPLHLLLLHSRNRPVRAVGGGSEEDGGGGLVGEDSAAFRLGDQSLASWAYFGGILAAVLFALNVLWIDPTTGFGTRFLDSVASISDSHEVRAVAVLEGSLLASVLRISFVSVVSLSWVLMDKKISWCVV
jgi:hypothetical protein